MEVRFSTDPAGFRRMRTDELRASFLIEGLFLPGKVSMVYSDIDRSITGSAVPLDGVLDLQSSKKEMAAEHFLERREIGIINIGSEGMIQVDGTAYPMACRDALYIGQGMKSVKFSSVASTSPAKFYFVSYPAHRGLPVSHACLADAEPSRLGSTKDANRRTIYKYIHPDGIKSCQLVMGLTELEEGSVWNTMPPHTHQRRSEVYMYYNLPPSAMVVHLFGQPGETRHLIVRNEQAVLNPSWSIHAGVGTQNYSFIWAMGGENQVFEDMDAIRIEGLR